jgi:hypothetical protein
MGEIAIVWCQEEDILREFDFLMSLVQLQSADLAGLLNSTPTSLEH